MTTTLDYVQHLADELSPLDQIRLIEYLSRQIAPVLAKPVETSASALEDDPWEKLARLREELALLPSERLASEQLNEDRNQRQRMLEGIKRVHS